MCVRGQTGFSTGGVIDWKIKQKTFYRLSSEDSRYVRFKSILAFGRYNPLKNYASHSDRNLRNWTPITYRRLCSSAVFHHIDSGYVTTYIYSNKVFDRSRPKIPAYKWPILFVIGNGAQCGPSEQRPACLGRFRVFHRCDLLHFRNIFSVIHFYVGGGSTYHESHNSGQYLHDTNFCPAAECTQWSSADEITWLSSANSTLTSLRALLIFLVISLQNKGLNWRRFYQSNDSLISEDHPAMDLVNNASISSRSRIIRRSLYVPSRIFTKWRVFFRKAVKILTKMRTHIVFGWSQAPDDIRMSRIKRI